MLSSQARIGHAQQEADRRYRAFVTGPTLPMIVTRPRLAPEPAAPRLSPELEAAIAAARRSLVGWPAGKVRAIQAAVAEIRGVPVDVILGRERKKRASEARQLAIYLSRKLTRMSLPWIGRQFGRDHTTILHAVRRTERRAACGRLDGDIEAIMAKLWKAGAG